MSLGIDESKAKDVETDRAVDASYRILRIIWLVILFSVIAIFVVSRLVQPTPDGAKVLFWILLAIGLCNLGASFILKQRMLKQAIEQRKIELVQSAYIVAFGLCESIAIFGLIVHLTTGIEYYYFFFVLSGFGILLHKPQRDDLLAASVVGNVWEARKSD
jgi:F0F1-type ATP synthase membrane subunit c/vacuolar-type H+-ATPase subunit K